MEALTFNSIRLNALPDMGQFRTAKGMFKWKAMRAHPGLETKRLVQLEASDVQQVEWTRSHAKEFRLKFVMKNQDIYYFDGFKEADYSALAGHASQHWKTELKETKLATKGWNWGTAQIEGKNLRLTVDDMSLLELCSDDIAQITSGNTDVNVILKLSVERPDPEDQLVEIRFHLPAPKDAAHAEACQSLKKRLQSISGTPDGGISASMLSCLDVKVLIPAGRYNLDITSSAIKLIGKSNDFNVLISDMSGLYCLPSHSSPHVNFIIQLKSPLRRGHTFYHNIIMQFDIEKPIAIDQKQLDNNADLNKVAMLLKRESLTDTSRTPADDSVKAELQQPKTEPMSDDASFLEVDECNLVTSLIEHLSKLSIIEPTSFKSSQGQCCFRCSYKAESGSFYPLENLFVYIPKPVHMINYSSIDNVAFARTQGSRTKLFEFIVILKDGQTLNFSSVDRHESLPLMNFFKSKGITTKSFDEYDQDNAERVKAALGGSSDDLSDENFEIGGSEEDDDESESGTDSEDDDDKSSDGQSGGHAAD